ncbi:MAG: GNAT family N-acetyltransferase [Myxococcales bacterium]
MSSTTNFEIRSPSRQELPAVALLAAKMVRVHHSFDPDRFFITEAIEPGYERFLASELQNPQAVLLAAYLDGRVVGYAYGRIEPRDWAMLLDTHGALHDLFVDESARGQGIGRRLVTEAVRRLESLGAPRVVLYAAWPNEGAQRLFESLGFRRTMVEMTREKG